MKGLGEEIRFAFLLTSFFGSVILTTVVVNITDRLMALGFSEYEARIYVSLLRDNPVTAYEAAKGASVPSAKVYGVLSKLVDKGLVLELMESGKKRYVPQDPDVFLESYRTRVEKNVSVLSADLKKESVRSNVSYIWNLKSREELLDKAKVLISQCRSSLLLSIWKEDLRDLLPEIHHAESAGVDVVVVHFGEPEVSAGLLYRHPIADTLYQEKGGRGFVLVADSQQALMATIQSEDSVEGAWSGSSGFVTLAEDYVKHDIYIMKIVNRFDQDLKNRFGSNYEKLRDIFHDDEV